jgi:polysaccharide export outer membrane protein
MAQNRNCGFRGVQRVARLGVFFLPALLLACLVMFSANGPARAQVQAQTQLPTADQLQQLQQRAQTNQAPAAVTPQPDMVLQAATPTRALATSRLEDLMSRRAGEAVRQFGYNVMGSGRSVSVPQLGAVQDDYVLGPGDEIVVSLRGQENSELRSYIDRNGSVIFPRLNPISATGRTFGSFRQDVQAAVHRAYVATEAFVSIARVRQISVVVTGEVNEPGPRIATALSSVVDALLISGGVRKTGSLRNIRLIRGGRESTIDLYAYLGNQGGVSNIRLADGDRIVVPQLGGTVAVTGVRRPGIYELPAGVTRTTVAEVMRLGQGELVRGAYRESLLQTMPDGRQQFTDVTGQPRREVRDGEILSVTNIVDQAIGRVVLRGAVRVPGDFSLDRTPTLQDLLPNAGVFTSTPEPYMLFGIIQRINTKQLRREVIPFSPLWVLQKKQNVTLQSDDIVMVLTIEAMRELADPKRKNDDQNRSRRNVNTNNNVDTGTNSNAGGNAFAGENNADNNGSSGVDNGTGLQTRLPNGVEAGQALASAQAMVNGQPNYVANGPGIAGGGQGGNAVGVGAGAGLAAGMGGNFRNGPSGGQGASSGGVGASLSDGQTGGIAGSIGDLAGRDALLPGLSVSEISFIGKEYKVEISGAVHDPGAFLVMPGTTLGQIVDAAHGLDSDVDLTHVEVTATNIDNTTGFSTTERKVLSLPQGNFDSVVVKPLDQINFRHVFSDLTEGSVTLAGEVRYPGTYRLLRGEHLSSLIARAGGLTSVAYPYGTVFLRASAARAEKAGYQRAAQDMDEQLLTATTRQGADKVTPDSLASLQSFVAEIRNQPALGRISIVADPSLLAARPQTDPLMEPGDSVTIPQRPTTVTVLGQVMQQGSYPYERNETAADYIARAGGYARFADDDNTFIVLPDGSARKMDKSWLSFDATSLPPGSTVVVPRDVTPFNLRQTVIDISQIFSQLAVSMASILVISRTN